MTTYQADRMTPARWHAAFIALVPDHLRAGLAAYVLDGNAPGGFLNAVLTNDLREAVARADGVSMVRLSDIISWLHNYAPAPCWGDVDLVARWQQDGGARGRRLLRST